MSDDLTTRLAQVLDKHHRFGRVGCLCGTPFKANVLDAGGRHLGVCLAAIADLARGGEDS